MAEKAYHVRSISWTSRSHPVVARVEEEIKKLKSWEASSSVTETVSIGLSGLEDLYDCLKELLQLPLTQQALAQQQQEKCVEQLLDGSLRLLDMCGTLRDVSFQMKEHVHDRQSSLRRGKSTESGSESKCICSMKKAKREFMKSLDSLKRMDKKTSQLLDQDQHLSTVIRLLKEARALTISIFQSISTFIYAAEPKRSSKLSFVSKLMHKGQTAWQAEDKDSAQNRLQELDIRIQSIEDGLECLFRYLIQTRVDLLNIISH